MELELFGYLGGLKPGDVSHPTGCEATRPGVLVQAWRLADGQAETASVLAQILSLFAKHSSSSRLYLKRRRLSMCYSYWSASGVLIAGRCPI
jgi:hypothetical protein